MAVEPTETPAPASPGEGDVTTIMAQLAALQKAQQGPPAAPVVKPAEVAATPEAKPGVDLHAWLADLETRVKAKDAADATTAAKVERDALAGQLADLVSKGDAAKLKDALAKLEGHYTGQIAAASAKESALLAQVSDGVRDAAIARAVLGVKFVSPSAEADALEKLGRLVEVVKGADGKFTARAKDGTGRSVADLAKERFASPEFGHLFPATAGGGGLGGGDRPGPSGGQAGSPTDLVSGVLAKVAWQKTQQERAGMFATPGLRTPRLPK